MHKLSVIPATILILRAHFDRLAGRLGNAKEKVERIKFRYPDVLEFIDAYHGFLLINERKIDAAEELFRKNINSLPNLKNDNQRYIELFCRYFLYARDGDFDWEILLSEAHELRPDSLTKRILILPTKDQVTSSLNA